MFICEILPLLVFDLNFNIILLFELLDMFKSDFNILIAFNVIFNLILTYYSYFILLIVIENTSAEDA